MSALHPLDVLNHTKDPYTVGCAVILSGHTTDAAVNKALPGFLAQYPGAEQLVLSQQDTVIPLLPGIAHIRPKYSYMLNWAGYVISCQGRFNATISDLCKLKGIGRKTASVILHHTIGSDLGFPLDTHCNRVFTRLGWLGPGSAITREKALLHLFPEGHRYSTYLSLTWHGRTICKAIQPQCDSCHLRLHCTHRRGQIPERTAMSAIINA